MKYPVALLTALTLLGFASSASATGITSSGGATPTIKAAGEGHVTIDNPIAKIECAASLEGKIESHGAESTASASVSTLAFANCTNSWHVTVVTAGSLEIHATSAGNGTVTASGATIEATRFGITCRYASSNTDLGALTGSHTTDGNATLDLAATIPLHGGSAFCGSSSAALTGNLVFTAPEIMEVDAGVGGEIAGLVIEPDPVEFVGLNDIQTVDILNPGPVMVKKLEISAISKDDFKVSGTCSGTSLKKTSGSCQETVECLKAKATGAIVVQSQDPTLLMTSNLKC